MKASYYNYIFHTDTHSYWMNGITLAYLKFSRGLGTKLESLLENPDVIKNDISKLYDILCNGGFIIPEAENELDTIRKKYNETVASKNYFLIILPTLDCNFECHYCVQSHIQSKMTLPTIEKVKRHIKYMVENEGLSSLTLEWFGGEPFLYFDEVIKPITLYAKEICSNNNICFKSAATSNASLITTSISTQLKSLSFRRFQITLDGDKALHDSIKYNAKIPSAFDTTLQNISDIITNNPDILIYLRINYTEETLHSNLVQEICDRLPDSVRRNIIVTLKKVWQHNVNRARFSIYLDILKKFRENGFNVVWLDIAENFTPCYVNKKYYACINHDGSVIKCTNSDDLYSKNPPGRISDSGAIEWQDNFDIKNQEPSFENPSCTKCKRLPICMGNCPKNHMQSKAFNCKWNAIEIDLKEAIIALIDDAYQQ